MHTQASFNFTKTMANTKRIAIFSLLLLILCNGFLVTPHKTIHSSSLLQATLWRGDDDNKDQHLPAWTLATILTCTLAVASPAQAVSGGGLDYANLDISGQDFSNNNYKGKDFTQVIAKATKFTNSNLQGCRFYKAYLAKADFTGADLRGAALEDTSMDEASFKNANAAGAYFSASILEAANLENADFTEAQFPTKTLPLLCNRPDVKGTNPKTGVDTRESLMCP